MTSRSFVVTILIILASFTLIPPTSAGPVLPTTPKSAGCILTNTDSCATTYVSGNGIYGFGFTGAFNGTMTVTASKSSNPGISQTLTCTGTFVTVLSSATLANGPCLLTGVKPPKGGINLACSSSGTGTVACTISGD